MTPERLKELQRLALTTNNAALHTLLRLWEGNDVPFEDWAHCAIVALAKQNSAYLAHAIDAEMRAPPRPMIIVKDQG